MAAKFELYKDEAAEYRWCLRAGGNRIIADSAEGYSGKAGAEEGTGMSTPAAPVNDKT